jgi:hypothetical protein
MLKYEIADLPSDMNNVIHEIRKNEMKRRISELDELYGKDVLTEKYGLETLSHFQIKYDKLVSPTFEKELQRNAFYDDLHQQFIRELHHISIVLASYVREYGPIEEKFLQAHSSRRGIMKVFYPKMDIYDNLLEAALSYKYDTTRDMYEKLHEHRKKYNSAAAEYASRRENMMKAYISKQMEIFLSAWESYS